jgi:hypothetical protein
MRLPKDVRLYLSRIGKAGGEAKSDAKAKAVRKNGKLGGRPRRFPRCRRYPAHRFTKRPDGEMRCPCGFVRPA